MEAYFHGRQSLVGLVVVMDSRRPLTDFDRQMLAWAGHAGCAVHVLLTKADKLSRSKASAALHATRRALDPGVGVQLFSALKGTGVETARAALDDMLGLSSD
jgi:GTP-binding protein